jgi:hypothetical protein
MSDFDFIIFFVCYIYFLVANYPPEIKNGNVTIQVSVGGNFSLQLVAEDQNKGDTIFFLLNPDAPSGLTVNNATKMLTWVNIPDSNSMSIQVTVSDGKAQSLWTPKIKLCKCKVRNLMSNVQSLLLLIKAGVNDVFFQLLFSI